MGRRLTWKVDELNQVTLKVGLGGTNRILLNGQEAARQKVRKNTTIPFSLGDGRPAEMLIFPHGAGLYPDRELRVEGQVILSDVELKQVSCLKCGKKAKPGDKFCEKCGAEIPKAEIQRKIIKMRGARNAIAAIAGIFLVFGAIMYFVQDGVSSKALKNISQFKDADVYPELVNGKQYTVGALREEIQSEPLQLLAVNVILAVIMFSLYLYARKSPLVAIFIALGVYASVMVLNAIIDPKTIGQGLVMKIVIIALLISGIRSALELRKVEV